MSSGRVTYWCASLTFLCVGLALRLHVAEIYETSVDLAVRLNWATRIARAQEFGPIGPLLEAVREGGARQVVEALQESPGSLLYALSSGLVFPTEVMRIGSIITVALGLNILGSGLESARLLCIFVDLLGVVLIGLLAKRLFASNFAALGCIAVLSMVPGKVLFASQAFYHVFGVTGSAFCVYWLVRLSQASDLRPRGRMPWVIKILLGILFGCLMYFDWLISQVAFACALLFIVFSGDRERRMSRVRDACGVLVFAVLVAAPAILYLTGAIFLLDWDPYMGLGTSEDNVMTLRMTRSLALYGYLESCLEYFTKPVVLISGLGLLCLLRDRARQGALALVGAWLLFHVAFFGFFTSIGADRLRAFQLLEVPMGLLAGYGASEFERSLAKLARAKGFLRERVSAVVAMLLVIGILVGSAGRTGMLLYYEPDRLPLQLPGFHEEYGLGPGVPELCGKLEALLPVGSSLLASQFAWPLVESVCQHARRISVVNLSGLCGRDRGAAQDAYLSSHFPDYRSSDPIYVLLEHSDGSPVEGRLRCLDLLRQQYEMSGYDEVGSGLGPSWMGEYRILRLR